jgi:uncharacterized protein (DUF2267 family)
MSHLFDDEYDNAWRYERFVTRVAEREGVSREQAVDHARAVFTTLREAMPDMTLPRLS